MRKGDREMTKKYDDASWHYGGNYPVGLPTKNGATHIGMFLAWCIENDLIAKELEDESTEGIQKVKTREMTGAEFLIQVLDERILDEDLSELGQAFANDYYEMKTKFGKKFGFYLDDYVNAFGEIAKKRSVSYETLYHVEDSWENYDLLRGLITRRFAEWRKFRKK
jgi:hypothetical protein